MMSYKPNLQQQKRCRLLRSERHSPCIVSRFYPRRPPPTPATHHGSLCIYSSVDCRLWWRKAGGQNRDWQTTGVHPSFAVCSFIHLHVVAPAILRCRIITSGMALVCHGLPIRDAGGGGGGGRQRQTLRSPAPCSQPLSSPSFQSVCCSCYIKIGSPHTPRAIVKCTALAR